MHYLLLLGALTLLSVGTLGLNNLLLETRGDTQTVRLTLPAIHAAHSLVEWGATLRFDEAGGYLDPSLLTDWDDLGPDPGENEAGYDDVDDLDGLVRVFDPQGVPYSATVDVSYVDDTDLDQPVTTETSYKLMTVTVTGEYLLGTFVYRSVFAAGL